MNKTSVRVIALVGTLIVGAPTMVAPVRAQSGPRTIRGTVTDGHAFALPGAHVTVPRLDRGSIANGNGRYVLDRLPSDTMTVLVSFVGHESVSRVVDLRQGDAVEDFVLFEVVEILNEVTVEDDAAEAALTVSPQSVSRLEAADLAVVRGQTLGQTLDRLPGVTTLSTGPSIQKPVIRGLHSDRVIVVNDGIQQEGQQWGAEHAPEIDPFAPARIEVVKGAAGVEYGAGAIGGVVRIEDDALPEEPGVGGRAMLNAFSNSQQGAGSLEVEGGSRMIRGLGARVQVSARRAGSAQTPNYVLGNTAFFERAAEIALGYTRGQLELEGHVSRFATDIGIYRGSHFNTFAGLDTVLALGRPPVDYEFSYEIGAPKQDIVHDLGVVRARYDLGDGARAEVQYGFQHNRRKEYDADRVGGRDPLERAAFDLTLSTHSAEAKLQTAARPVLGGNAFAHVGLSGMNQGNSSDIGYLIPNFRAYTGGAFARTNWFNGPLTLDAGARLDVRQLRAYPREDGGTGDFERVSRRWWGVSGAVGGILRFAETRSVAVNLSAAWRPPSVNELYSYGVHHGTAQFELGNAGMDAERSVGVDLTIRQQSERLQLDGSVYVNRIGDYIYLVPTGEAVVTVRGVFPEFQYDQTDAVLAGFDGFANVQLVDHLGVELVASVVRGTDTSPSSGSSEPLLQMPADRLGISLSYTIPTAGVFHDTEFDAGVRLVRRQDRYPTRANEEGASVPLDYVAPPDGYALFRVGVHGELDVGSQTIQYGLAVENLLNTEYRDYLSRYRYFAHDPGRNVVLRIQVPFGTRKVEH